VTLTDIQARLSALPSDILAKPERLFAAVFEFYETIRLDNSSLEEDGDMLLFQWGSYDWGHGLNFELDLTRQSIPFGEEDPPICQLQCTYRFDPAQISEIPAGNRWCHQPNEDLGIQVIRAKF
jgi:hypothetical protein